MHLHEQISLKVQTSGLLNESHPKAFQKLILPLLIAKGFLGYRLELVLVEIR